MLYYYHEDAIHISKIDLYVKDLNISKAFYIDQLGFSILQESNDYVALTTDNQRELLRLHQNQNLDTIDQAMNIYHFALLLPTRKDLGKFLHHLILKQIPIDGAADHKVSEAIYLQDPDGIGIEIYCDKDDSLWQKDKDSIDMDTLPFDYKGVYYEANPDDIFSKLPIETTIGHLHLQTDQLEKAKDFYHKIIGFDIVNDKMNGAVFMSDKNYHHHLAINSWKQQKNKIQKLRSFTINYPNCEKFKKTYEMLQEMNIEYQETMDGVLIKDPENTEIYLNMK